MLITGRLLNASREEAHLDLSLTSSGVGQNGGEDSAVAFGDANSPTYERTFQSARQIPGISKRECLKNTHSIENTFYRPRTGIKQERRSPQERRCGRRDRRTQTQTKSKDDRSKTSLCLSEMQSKDMSESARATDRGGGRGG
jgi:hypothetical protein